MLKQMNAFRLRVFKFLDIFDGGDIHVVESGTNKTRPWGFYPKIDEIRGARTIEASESGTLFVMWTAAADYTITLPEPTRGMHFRFIIQNHTAAGNIVIDPHSRTNNMHGGVSSAADGGVASSGEGQDRITFGDNTYTGDNVELVSYGSNNWIVTGWSRNLDGVVLSTA